jgi:DNA-binding YbaB/EbfC family protein
VSYNVGKMLKQAQKIQAEVARVQEELGSLRVEATAGGGAVVAVANGRGELQSLTIDPEAVDPGDISLLQDMIVAAVNEAQRKASTLAEERMQAVTRGLQMPGLPS